MRTMYKRKKSKEEAQANERIEEVVEEINEKSEVPLDLEEGDIQDSFIEEVNENTNPYLQG